MRIIAAGQETRVRCYGWRHTPRSVFHAVGPVYAGGERDEPDLLAACYRKCFELAEEHKARSISFPSISTGAYGYPLREAADIAMRRGCRNWCGGSRGRGVRIEPYGSERSDKAVCGAGDSERRCQGCRSAAAR